MMKILWFLGRIKCKLGYHHIYMQVVWCRDDPDFGGVRFKCFRCGRVIKEDTMTRPNWDLYFIQIAIAVAARSTCKRASVGAVITRHNWILSTGYNGAPAGAPHCLEVGCIVKNDHCVRAVHAEINAINHAKELSISLADATLYYWDSKGRYAQTMEDFTRLFPKQAKAVKAAGISRICGRGL